MVRPKGGRAEPRDYYYKEAAEEKLVKLLEEGPIEEYVRKPVVKEDEITIACRNLKIISQAIDEAIIIVKKKIEGIRKCFISLV